MRLSIKQISLFVLTIISLVLLTFFSPLEKTLGESARVVYLHGAWVWAALLVFLTSALIGASALIFRKPGLHQGSLALGWTGLILWVSFLLTSLYVMQVTWNGIFIDEPRFRIPLNFAVFGLLLQVGVFFLADVWHTGASTWTSLVNLFFGAALLIGMSGIQTVLHPESPIFQADAQQIQVFFFGLLLLLLLASVQIAFVLAILLKRRPSQ